MALFANDDKMINDVTEVNLENLSSQEKFYDYFMGLMIRLAGQQKPQDMVLRLPAAKLKLEHVHFLIQEFEVLPS